MLSAFHIELPAVPRASHDAADKLPFAERSALVRANAVEREELAVDIKQCDDAVADDNFQ